MFKRKMKLASVTLVLFFVFSLVGPYVPAPAGITAGIPVAEASGTQPIGNLQVGDKVVDNSWTWQFRTGHHYTYNNGDVTKPVTWVVVAKNHYSGLGSHVTLLSEEVIGRQVFDNSTHITNWGSNHWGNSGTHSTAVRGIRPWLNSTGIHAGEGFYNAFSGNFKSDILTTTVPNKERGDSSYTTQDKVFLPSTTELGDTDHTKTKTYEVGTAYPHFDGAKNADRIAQLPEYGIIWYWTRSPAYAGDVCYVRSGGGFRYCGAIHGSNGIRPALNLKSEIPVSVNPGAAGAYVIGGGPGEPEQTATPLLTITARTINTATISIEGTAEPSATIRVTGGAAEATRVADGEGNFSVEVTLTPDAVNNLSFIAKADGKIESEAATVAITHETIDPTDPDDPGDEIKYGDVTGNGSITIQDAIAVLRHIVGLQILDPAAQQRAKVTRGSDEITVQDAILILRYIVGLIDEFPVEK